MRNVLLSNKKVKLNSQSQSVLNVCREVLVILAPGGSGNKTAVGSLCLGRGTVLEPVEPKHRDTRLTLVHQYSAHQNELKTLHTELKVWKGKGGKGF